MRYRDEDSKVLFAILCVGIIQIFLLGAIFITMTLDYARVKRTDVDIPKIEMPAREEVEYVRMQPYMEPEVRYFDVPLDEELQDHIFNICEERGIDPALVVAVIKKESTFRAGTVGDNGNSLGLMQIQPRWHSGRMAELGCDDLLDPYQNVLVGVDYLAEMIDIGGSVEWGLMAYNGGPSYANRLSREGRVSAYAETVLEYSEGLGG